MAHAEWTKVSEDTDGWVYYLDLDRIQIHDGWVNYWTLTNLPTRTKEGVHSGLTFYQAECKRFRWKLLSSVLYSSEMGQGKAISMTNEPEKNWNYPSPNAIDETILQRVCAEKILRRNR